MGKRHIGLHVVKEATGDWDHFGIWAKAPPKKLTFGMSSDVSGTQGTGTVPEQNSGV